MKIGISPGVGILAVFRYIKYKPWYALAEYIDNSIDSYKKNIGALKATYENYRLLIDIEFDAEENRITISDNAAGINAEDLERALRMAIPPPDRSGLSEFGMGMKAASCWFSPKWSVETQALGDAVKRVVTFDVNSIVDKQIEFLDVVAYPSVQDAHFTNVYLTEVYSMPTKHVITKIKEHLANIYRGYLREGSVVITVNGKPLSYKTPAILVAPPASDKTSTPVQWRKDLDFTCAGGQHVTGFAALYATASTKEAGFALLRRGRVVEGSFEEGYRPVKIFGNSNSYYYQRIFGELNLDDFTASFTKDGMQWEDAEEDFLTRLKLAMKAPGLDLLKQANDMRVKEGTSSTNNKQESASQEVKTQLTNDNLIRKEETEKTSKHASNSSENKITQSNSNNNESVSNNYSNSLTTATVLPATETRSLTTILNGISWRIYLELSRNPAHTNWISVNNKYIPETALPAGNNERLLGVRISLTHPFTQKYCNSSSNELEASIRIGSAIALARVVTKEGGALNSNLLIEYINELLNIL